MTDFSEDAMQRRYHAITRERAAIEKKAKPARDKRDALAAKMAAIEEEKRPLDRAVRDLEAPLAGLANEQARLARALGGRVGTPE